MQEWKASEKEAQKMTRDGAISVNLVTGEATHISARSPEQDYSSADETAGALNRAADEVVGHRERRQAKKARRKRRDTFREGEAARDRPSSRLQFSETDQAAPELKKAIRKSDKAADRLDAAKAAVPVKPPGKEHGRPLSRPVQEIRSTLHGEVSKVEGDNSGVQAGHLGERQIEKAVGYGGRRIHQARADRKFCNRYPPCRKVWAAGKRVVKFIGYDAGESYRSDKVLLGDLADQKYSKWYPLMEWGWDRAACMQAIENAGLPQPGKSSCFFCPSMRAEEIIHLRDHHPDLFRRAIALEDNARPNLKTVQGLGRNYSWKERFGKENCTHGNC